MLYLIKSKSILFLNECGGWFCFWILVLILLSVLRDVLVLNELGIKEKCYLYIRCVGGIYWVWIFSFKFIYNFDNVGDCKY